jgi:hypothetical protein
MQQLTLTLPDDLHERVRALAEARGVTVEQIVREAVEQTAAEHLPEPESWPRPKSIGAGDSGRTDVSRLASEGRVPPRSWR